MLRKKRRAKTELATAQRGVGTKYTFNKVFRCLFVRTYISIIGPHVGTAVFIQELSRS